MNKFQKKRAQQNMLVNTMKLIRKIANLALFGFIASFLFIIFASSIGVFTIDEMKQLSLELILCSGALLAVSGIAQYIEVKKS